MSDGMNASDLFAPGQGPSVTGVKISVHPAGDSATELLILDFESTEPLNLDALRREVDELVAAAEQPAQVDYKFVRLAGPVFHDFVVWLGMSSGGAVVGMATRQTLSSAWDGARSLLDKMRPKGRRGMSTAMQYSMLTNPPKSFPSQMDEESYRRHIEELIKQRAKHLTDKRFGVTTELVDDSFTMDVQPDLRDADMTADARMVLRDTNGTTYIAYVRWCTGGVLAWIAQNEG